MAGRDAQPHASGQLGDGEPAVPLQLGKNFPVQGIHGEDSAPDGAIKGERRNTFGAIRPSLPHWAYAIAAGLRDRSVVPAVAGLIAGYAGYTLLAVAGLVVLVASSATVLTALTLAGAGYLCGSAGACCGSRPP
ncbi:hypothetical protein GCM10010383_33570 [Streptomyces lomondensis]|uniref:Uncharacterized protein n=1 Tax=Streptomyces lomondensis TaxID=68229 RepID=A0ABQ2X606_9ACTN|nr:hypothetical protein GCM10010383_33570 [Streptomyces lomondensis]